MNRADSPLLGASPAKFEAPCLRRWGGIVLGIVTLSVGLLLLSLGPNHKTGNFFPVQASISTFMETLLDLDNRMDGRVILPASEDFPEACVVWNQVSAFQPLPKAVIEVASERDVQLAMQVVLSLNVSFSIRSGGHSKAGYSNAPNGIIVSLKRLNRIQVFQGTAQEGVLAKLGPGIKGTEVIATTLPLGYAAVVGQCSNVAAGGFVLGGGWGIMTRKHGLGLDNLVSAKVVLASSEAIETNSTHYRDLFWALRGAGIGNFGVVTEMTYRLHPAQNALVCGWDLTVPAVQAAELLHIVSSREFPREMHFTLEEVGHPMIFSVLWQCPERSCLEAGSAFLRQELAALVKDAQLKISPCNWSDNSYASDDTNLVQTYTGFLKPVNCTVEIIQTIIDTCYEWTVEMGSMYVMPDMELWGGKISDFAPNATAFPHRDAVYNVGVVVEVPRDQPTLFSSIVGRLNSEWHRIGQFLDGAYVNYQMASLGSQEYAEAYWGPNVQQLQKVKRKYDPNNIFTYPQGIPTV